jgi:Transposase DNA-binding/Transposase DDE domain
MRERINVTVTDMAAEFEGESLGDARLDERLRRIVSLAAMDPGESFPDQMASVADREALYRFLANPKVTMAGVLSGHVRQTHDRLRHHALIRIVHDTTTFRFVGDRAGLGEIRGGAQGFFGHVALAVAADDTREPLGVLGVHPFIHQDTVARRALTRGAQMKASRAKPRAVKESARWEQLALQVAAALPAGVAALHVMDQEADDYDVLAALHEAQLRYVIRVAPHRQTTDATHSVQTVLTRQPATLFRTVRLTPRSARKAARTRGRHPARADRDATLHLRWGVVALQRRPYTASHTPTLSVWAVHVFEPHPPPGEVPVEWMLVTSEAVETADEAAAIVDHYRARWLIEDYFKALKTGCAFETRQLTTFDGLVRALAIFIPLAWRLLALRHLGRAASALPVARCLDADQIHLLRQLLDRRRYLLPPQLTIRDVMLGVAALGGHITTNGAPGWLVLGRGLTRLLDAEIGWRLARRCDQS